MKIPAAWLQNYLSRTMSPRQMAEALERAGIEVEQILYTPKWDKKIIVAEIKKIVQHPNADRLHLVSVLSGKVTHNVVCGAPNLEIGQKVALAQVGASLPDGTKVVAATIRGQKSAGMLCSPKELGLGNDHSGLLILPADAKTGRPLAEVYAGSDIIDVSTHANRPDLLSLIGLAKEVAAQTNQTVKVPKLAESVGAGDEFVPVKLVSDLTRRYQLQKFKLEGARPGKLDTARQLESAGIRPINPVVDITNFVMLEQGQPLHAFDADKVKLPITVRLAKLGEQLVTLDGVKRRLSVQDLVIADAKGVIALAGVMGGQRTEVDASTKAVLIESATFDAVSVRKNAQRHGLRTEASARFERGLPVKLAAVGLARAAELLISQLGAAAISQVTDLGDKTTPEVHVTVDPKRLSTILSLEVRPNRVKQLLPRLGFKVNPIGAGALEVEVPWWRSDIKLEEDVAEELIRLIGYDEVPASLPVWRPNQSQPDSYWPALWQIKAALKGLGLFEVITYSFISQASLARFGYEPSTHLKVKNPLSIEQAYLRRSLLPSLLAAAERNQHYRGQIELYEVSRVFLAKSKGEQPDEPRHLAALLVRPQAGYEAAKAALDQLASSLNLTLTIRAKAANEFAPNLSAEVWAGTTKIGRIGQLHPRLTLEFKQTVGIGYLELDIDRLLLAAGPRQYQVISKFPSIWRDLAVVVPDKVWWQDVAKAIDQSGEARPQFLSDYYGGELPAGHKSLAIRLEMSSLDGTLTGEQAEQRLAAIIELLEKQFGAKLKQ